MPYAGGRRHTSVCYLKHPVSKGQFLISRLTVGSSSLRLLRCKIKLTVSETQCGKQVSSEGPDWTMAILTGQVVLPLLEMLPSTKPDLPLKALPLSCPLLPGANPFTTALEAPTSYSGRKKEA